MSQEQKPLKTTEITEKFYKTEEFKQLSVQEKREKLIQHAQKVKTQLNKNYTNIVQNSKTTVLALGGAYVGYRLLRWAFGNKKKTIEATKTIVLTEKKQKKQSILVRIQDKVLDFIWDFAIEAVQEQLINRFFKKKKKKKNGKKDS